jgi:hypothetical protein
LSFRIDQDVFNAANIKTWQKIRSLMHNWKAWWILMFLKPIQ